MAPESRSAHPVADAIGACFRGAREGDRHVRARARGWLAFLTGGGFAVYVGIRLINLVDAQVRQGWAADARDRQELVQALRDQTEKISALVEKFDTLAKRGQRVIIIERKAGGFRSIPVETPTSSGAPGGYGG